MKTRAARQVVLVAAGVLAFSGFSTRASTFDSKLVHFDVPAQPLASALVAFAEQAHVQLIVSTEDLEGLRGGDVHGQYSPQIVLDYLLKQSGLDYRVTSSDTVVVQRIALPTKN